jgi:hypothetical protein
MNDSHTFEELVLNEQEFAKMLGISVEEFLCLDRSGMYAYIRIDGSIEECFMYIHPDSLANVIPKLKIEQHNFIRFSFEQVQSVITEPECHRAHLLID